MGKTFEYFTKEDTQRASDKWNRVQYYQEKAD